jgi:site-specific recombinase XerC
MDISLKYSLLDGVSQQEVNDFLDFLLAKKKKSSHKLSAKYKKQILAIKTWSEDDLKPITDSKKIFNS